MTSQANLKQLNPEQLRSFAAELLQQVEVKDRTILHQQVLNDKLTHELAVLKRHRFGRRSETMNPDQTSLLDELDDADIAAIETALAEHAPVTPPYPVSRNPPSAPHCRLSSREWRLRTNLSRHCVSAAASSSVLAKM